MSELKSYCNIGCNQFSLTTSVIGRETCLRSLHFFLPGGLKGLFNTSLLYMYDGQYNMYGSKLCMRTDLEVWQ